MKENLIYFANYVLRSKVSDSNILIDTFLKEKGYLLELKLSKAIYNDFLIFLNKTTNIRYMDNIPEYTLNNTFISSTLLVETYLEK